MSQAACAHLRISYHTERDGDGITRGWWQCDSGCGQSFALLPAFGPATVTVTTGVAGGAAFGPHETAAVGAAGTTGGAVMDSDLTKAVKAVLGAEYPGDIAFAATTGQPSVNDARLTARMDAIDRLLKTMVETMTALTSTDASLLDAMRVVVERLNAVERGAIR